MKLKHGHSSVHYSERGFWAMAQASRSGFLNKSERKSDMKTQFALLRSKGASMKLAAGTVGVVGLGLGQAANAALPEWATGLGTQLQGVVTDAVAEVGPVVIISLVALMTIVLIKRFAKKI